MLSALNSDQAGTPLDRVSRLLLVLPMFGGIFLSRFALNLFQSKLGVSLLATAASVVGLALCNRLRINLPRVALYAVTLAALGISAMVSAKTGGGARFSTTSFLLLAVLYLGYVFVASAEASSYRWVLMAFRRMCLVVAVAGIVQFFGQFIVPGPTLFSFKGLIPENYLFLDFNDTNHLTGGLLKSNGFFLPEASIDSQLMALALIVEIEYFRNVRCMALFVVAIFLAYSGTGLILCGIFIPILMLRQKSPYLLLALIAAGMVIVFSLHSALLEPFTGRIGEFDSRDSSAFARFLSPLYLFSDYIFTSDRNVLFGLGPGSIEAYFGNFYTEVHDPTWAKVFFEYGFVGSLPFFIYVTSCFFADTRTRLLSAGLFVTYLFLGGYLLSASWNGIILSLVVWQRPGFGKLRGNRAAIGPRPAIAAKPAVSSG